MPVDFEPVLDTWDKAVLATLVFCVGYSLWAGIITGIKWLFGW